MMLHPLAPTFSAAVPVVVSPGSNPQMGRVAARRVIAGVQDAHAGRNVAAEQGIDQDVYVAKAACTGFLPATALDQTVPVVGGVRSPDPTITHIDHFGPEAGEIPMGILMVHREFTPLGAIPRGVNGAAGASYSVVQTPNFTILGAL